VSDSEIYDSFELLKGMEVREREKRRMRIELEEGVRMNSPKAAPFHKRKDSHPVESCLDSRCDLSAS